MLRTAFDLARTVLAAAMLLAIGGATYAATKASEALLADGRSISGSTIESCRIDADSFEVTLKVDGERRESTDLIRWGEPDPANDRATLLLADGSCLITDRPWSPLGLVRVKESAVSIRRGRGSVAFDRDQVSWVLLASDEAGLDRDRLPEPDAEEDIAYLRGGDRLFGPVLSLDSEALSIDVAGESVQSPLESVAALRLQGRSADRGGACLVGLDGGSLCYAESLTVANGHYTASVLGATLKGDAEALTLVQPLRGAATYLSDLEPVDYRHTPYLDLAWPLATDEGLLGRPLVGGGRRAAKGIAVHSAARVIYRLDGSEQQFQAEAAVADPPAEYQAQGSVVFRVYLVKEGEFVPAYESKVLRAGDPAKPIRVDTTGAAALALVVDYADDGDAGDHAIWLDARLVRTSAHE